jgi:hypothetical protein
MSFQVIYHEGENYIESFLEEDFNWSVMERMVPRISKWVNEKNCTNILLDFRGGNLDLSTLKIYLMPERLGEEFKKYGVHLLSLKRAMVIKGNDRDYHFLETVSINNNQNLHLFLDKDEAIKWLLDGG